MVKYSPFFKHNILTQYSPNQPHNGFHSLAVRFQIRGGPSTVKRWYDRWDGTAKSLERRATSGRPRLLTSRQVQQYIGAPIKKKNQLHQRIDYASIHQQIKPKINKSISLRTIRRYGKERLGIKKKRTKAVMSRECTFIHTNKTQNSSPLPCHPSPKQYLFGCYCFAVTKKLCDDIAMLRRKLIKISKRKVLFLDETHLRLSAAPTSTLVYPGESEFVVVEDNTSYAKRFDMIACCSGTQVFPPIIFTPKERADAGVKGINKKM